MMEMVERRERKGLPTPWWDSRPLPYEDTEFAWGAYQELATCKPLGFGAAGPIPWTAIHTYAEAHRLTWEEEEELRAYVWAIDAEMDKQDEKKS